MPPINVLLPAVQQSARLQLVVIKNVLWTPTGMFYKGIPCCWLGRAPRVPFKKLACRLAGTVGCGGIAAFRADFFCFGFACYAEALAWVASSLSPAKSPKPSNVSALPPPPSPRRRCACSCAAFWLSRSTCHCEFEGDSST